MVGILYCLASIAIGTSIALYFPRFERIEEKLTLGLILGFTLTTWATFIYSLLLKTFNVQLIGCVSIIAILASSLLILHYPKTKYRLILKPSRTYLISLIIFAFLLSIANFNTIKFDSQGNLVAMQHCWGDYAMHISYIMHFSKDSTLALNHPLLANHNLAYPFFVDFLSAIMHKSGLDYVSSIVLINIVLSIGLVSIIYLFAREFSGLEICGLFVLLLFLFNGNFGFIFALGKDIKEIILPTTFYTKIDPKGLVWGNTLSALFLSQRSLLWGMPIAVLVYFILSKEFSALQNNGPLSRRNFLLAGILLGSLPLIHTPSFLVVGFVALFLLTCKFRRNWFYFGIPAALLALPQALYLLQEHALSRAHWFYPGWMLKSANPLFILLFWIYNLGMIFFLLIAGISLIEKRKLFFYIPFFAIFLLANFILIHPSDWDNAKYFLHWFFLSCVIAGFALANILNYTQRWKKPDRIFLVTILVSLSIFSGVIDYIYLNTVSFVLADKKSQNIAEWVRKNISSTSLILTSDTHNHPVSMLSGRNIVLGYRGWLWSHGYDYRGLEEDVEKIYRSADLGLIKKYEITHIVISPYEKELRPNLNLFLKSEYFREIYKTKLDQQLFRIFEVVY